MDTLLDRENNPRALLLSGTGRYSDPQHDYDATSEGLAGVLEEAGFDVVIASDLEAALTWLSSPWNWPDLLAVNVGLPRDGQPVPAEAAASGLRSWLGSGRPLLAIHTSATSFTDVSEWSDALGQGPTGDETGGLAGTLRIVPDPDPAAEYPHPLGWTYERPDGGRTVFATGGHDAGAFQQPQYRELLSEGISWLADSLLPVGAPAE
ncbi:hypothetical protein KKR91_03300 [Arthrobacter jiangjiafuii]|uniref:ThuA-like domain-containing protein n=1 Tax=Arthrobacter jiangjiafuii TaxID=2817475 RepID=A0A975R1N2_9MICC|nr:hypothetical protein [Arthrobacter jiangjiafuii]MBP3043629.1 hypothetical protein [Arthrobacter jiangjiafuii]QWC10671.1 hypothetical protein KKR91_03300 [Arthrobacter jiangjiafuii]